MSDKKPGILYAMTDPHTLRVKLGRVEEPTVERLRQRWKSESNFGRMFVMRRAARVSDMASAEKMLLCIFAPYSVPGQREVFNVDPEVVCAVFHFIANGRGQKDLYEFIKEVREKVKLQGTRINKHNDQMWDAYRLEVDESQNPLDQENKSRRRSKLALNEMRLEKGDILKYVFDESVTAIVSDPVANSVILGDSVMDIKDAADLLQKRRGIQYRSWAYGCWKWREMLLKDLFEEEHARREKAKAATLAASHRRKRRKRRT